MKPVLTTPAGMRFEVEYLDPSDDDRKAFKKGAVVTLPAPTIAKA